MSRVRPIDEWLAHEVPALRVISEELWRRVKQRQDAQRPQRQTHWTGDPKRLSGSQALEKFRADFARRIQAKSREQSADQKHYKTELRELEARQANFVRAVGEGQALGTLLPALDDVERKIAAEKRSIEATRPRPIPMPENLPELYRAHIDDLVATLNKDEIVERAADELHRLIERIVVRHEPEAGGGDLRQSGGAARGRGQQKRYSL